MTESSDQPAENEPAPPPERPRKRRWRLLKQGTAVLLLLVFMVAASLWTGPGRWAVLRTASWYVEETTGFRVRAQDFDLTSLAGEIAFEGLSVAQGDAEPFVEVTKSVVEFRWGEILVQPLRLRSLVADGLAVHVGRLPSGGDDGDGVVQLPLSIDHVRVSGGVLGIAVEGEWLRTIDVLNTTVEGSLDAERFQADTIDGDLVLARPAGPATLRITGAVAGPYAGPYEIRGTQLEGEGLRLALDGVAGIGEDAPLRFQVDLQGDPAVFLADLEPGSHLEVLGTVDLPRREIDVGVLAAGVPASALEPWIDDAATVGGLFEVEGRLRATPAENVAELAGEGVLRWQREGKTLLNADWNLLEGRWTDAGVDVASLAGHAELKADDVPAGLLRPFVDADLYRQLSLAGTTLNARADLALRSVEAPQGTLDLDWRRSGEALAGVGLATEGTDGLHFDLALLPDEPGVRTARGTYRVPSWEDAAAGSFESTAVHLELPDPAAAHADLRRRWPELVPEIPPELTQNATGALDVDADLRGTLAALQANVRAGWSGTTTVAEVALDEIGADIEVDYRSAAGTRLDGGLTFHGPNLEGTFNGGVVLDLGNVLERGGGVLRATLSGQGASGEGLAGQVPGTARVMVAAEYEVLEGRGDLEVPALTVDIEDGPRLRLAGNLRGVEDFVNGEAGARLDGATLDADVDLRHLGVEALERVRLQAELDGGVLRIDPFTVATSSGRRSLGELTAEIPLANLLLVDPDLDLSWTEAADGPAVLTVVGLDVDLLALEKFRDELRARDDDLLAPLADALGGLPEVPGAVEHQFVLTGRLWLDSGDQGGRTQLSAARAIQWAEAEIIVENWRLSVVDAETSVERTISTEDNALVLNVDQGWLELEPVQLFVDCRPFNVGANASLSTTWTPGSDEPLLAGFDAEVRGTLAAELLNPFLAGGAASGLLQLDGRLSGTLEDPEGKITVHGPAARVVYASPYLTRFEDIRGTVELRRGTTTLRDFTARLNDGTLRLKGFGADNGDWSFGVDLEDVRYVVDYGLSTVLDGQLQLDLPAAILADPLVGPPTPQEMSQRGALMGTVNVQRAVLRRSLDLERELRSLLSPLPAAVVDPDDILAKVDLDVDVRTSEGVRVRNNVADLGASWSVLAVEGTLAEPRVSGTIDIEPGGTISVFGQISRVDQGTIELNNAPKEPPNLDLRTTSALEDSRVGRGGGGELDFRLRGGGAESDLSLEETLVAGLAGQVAERLGGIRIQLRPELLEFNETDPSTTLTLSRDISRMVALAVSVNLRNSQEQTYIVEFHELPRIPQLRLQVFTNGDSGAAESQDGATFQQRLLFGGGTRDEEMKRLRRIVLPELPEDLSERALRRAAGVGKGDPVGPGLAFETEVAVAEHLRRRGYPGAEVQATPEDAGGRHVDLRLDLELGPRVVFEFEGEKPPVSRRRTITAPYRVDFFEEASRAEVRAAMERTLREQGFLAPAVTVEPDTVNGDRTVVVRADGGRKVSLETLAFSGVPAGVEGELGLRFTSPSLRRELAFGVASADAFLLATLRSLGYPSAEVVGRQLSEDGKRLDVELRSGPRQVIRRLEVRGLAADDPALVRLGLAADPGDEGPPQRAALGAGDVPRADRLATLTVALRDALKRRGHADARVRARLQPVADGAGPDVRPVDVTVDVTPGPQYRLEAVEIVGARATRDRWARQRTRLADGEVLDPKRLAEARRHLSGSRLFRSVRTTVERDAPDDGSEGTATVRFNLDEAPRYELAYGLRWETGSGGTESAVVDAVDRNFLGRGLTVGLRTLYSDREQTQRFYFGRRSLFRKRFGFEIFVENSHKKESPDNVVDQRELSLSISLPIGPTTNSFYGTLRDFHSQDELFPGFVFDVQFRNQFVGWQVVYDTLDDRLAPNRGLFLSADLSASGDYTGSDFDFLRLFTQATHILPIFEVGGHRFTWAHSYRVGLFATKDDFPLSEERFKAGGDYSVRGYGQDSILDDDEPGQALLVLNQELRFDLWWEIDGLVFLDAGNVWLDRGDFGSDLLRSAGVGLRASTPIGLLRVDVAWPLDRRSGDESVTTYFGFGHAF